MIILKNNNEIRKMMEAGKIVEEALLLMEANIRPGISTLQLDQLAEEFITKQGAVPSFKGYGGFPGSICASVNDVVIHGIPSKEVILKDGDIISIDMGAEINRYHGDAARTFMVGEVSQEAKDLIRVTEESFFKGVEAFRVGNRLGDISNAIESHIVAAGFGVVKDFVGHGIGRNLHEQPNVPNYGKAGFGPVLREGMVLAIEPMVNVGSYEVKVLKDRWTVKTKDGSLSAHYENTVALTDQGPQLLTLTR